jgi:putative oxidoreductase
MPLFWNLTGGFYEWLGIGALLARLAVGLLFLLSGEGKLFHKNRREEMQETLVAAKVPFPRPTALFVSSVEFLFGGLLMLGALTPLCCVMLGGVMVVALITTQVRTIHATSLADWFSRFLYLPEVLYLVILVLLFFSGPGPWSVDHLLLERSGR